MSSDMFPDSFIQYCLENPMSNEIDTCSECGKKVETMAFRTTGVCGEDCRKKRDGETDEKPKSQTDAGITNLLNQPTGEIKLDRIY